jgi:1,4-alpha-glucan branching enzyme
MPTLELAEQSARSVTSRTHAMPSGAQFSAEGAALFRLWAPGVRTVGLDLPGRRERQNMLRSEDGWFTCHIEG